MGKEALWFCKKAAAAVMAYHDCRSFFLSKYPLMKSSAVAGGSFAATLQFEKLEIHKVFPSFPNFDLHQNLSPSTLADLIIGYLRRQNYGLSGKTQYL